MSLFVGNISRDADKGDIEKAFEKFGACKIRDKVSFTTLYFFSIHPSKSHISLWNSAKSV